MCQSGDMPSHVSLGDKKSGGASVQALHGMVHDRNMVMAKMTSLGRKPTKNTDRMNFGISVGLHNVTGTLLIKDGSKKTPSTVTRYTRELA